MSSNSQNTSVVDDEIDLLELLLAVFKYWYVVAICVFLALLLAFFYIKKQQPIYQVNGLVEVEDRQSGAAALLADSPVSGLSASFRALGQIEIIRSRSVLLDVVDQLNLDIEILPTEQSFLDGFFNKSVMPAYSETGVSYKIKNNSKLSELTVHTLELPERLQNRPLHLQFQKDGKYTLTSGASGQEKFSVKGVSGQMVSGDYGGSFFKLALTHANMPAGSKLIIRQLNPNTAYGKISGSLGVSEKGKNTGIIGLTYEGMDPEHIAKVLNRTLDVFLINNLKQKSIENKQTLSFLDKQLPELKMQLEKSESAFNRFREANGTINVDAEGQLLLQSSVDFEKRRSELIQKKAELSALYTSEYPLLKQINKEIAVVSNKLDDIKTRAEKLPEIQRQYLQLFRDVQVNSDLYTTLLKSYQELRVKQAGETGNVQIIDYALKPIHPIKPRKKLIILLAGVMGAFSGLLLALLLNFIRAGLRDTEVLVAQTGIPVVANIPRSAVQRNLLDKAGEHLLFNRNPQDMAIESLRSLRTSIHFGLQSAKNNRVLITGASPNIGKSFVTANLAAVMAQSGKTVLLIDGDMRRGHLNKYFNFDNVQGLSYGLQNKVHLDTLAKPTTVDNLFVLNRGSSPENPSELLLGDFFKAEMDRLSSVYDIVLIDSPPLLAVADAAILTTYSDATYIVARYEQSKLKEVKAAIVRVEQHGGKVRGIVFNDIQREVGSQYQYQYGYSYTSKQ